jgi:hypothetical protein
VNPLRTQSDFQLGDNPLKMPAVEIVGILLLRERNAAPFFGRFRAAQF